MSATESTRIALQRVHRLESGLKAGGADHMEALEALRQTVPALVMELDMWKRAALAKVRTRRAIVERTVAGDAAACTAADFDFPLEFVQVIGNPKFDTWFSS